MSSSNPFRKKGPPAEGSRFPPIEAIDTSVAPASRPPPPVSFRRGRSDDAHADDDDSEAPVPPPPAAELKPKVVKKVRVLSPPPLSPDSPEWSSNPVPPAAAAFPEDPFNNGIADDFGGDRGTPPPPPPPLQQQQQQQEEYTPPGGPPPNPFSKTLQDLENSKKEQELKEERREEGAVLKAANSRASLNVDSFRRLLMTGNTGDGSGTAGQEGPARPGAPGVDDAHGETRGASREHHNPNPEDEGDVSDSSTAVQFGQRKKAPPPPPSSRHGRSIADHAKTRDASGKSLLEGGDAEPHHADDSTAKPQDPGREPTGSAKKSAPAPPPRRGHTRGESKSHVSVLPRQKSQDEDIAPSPSPEAVPARTNSFRSTHAPAPPPRRRTNPANRLSMTSPTSGGFHTAQQLSQESEKSTASTPSYEAPAPLEPSAIQDPYTGNIKMSAPPPPPARNSSIRRPPSSSSSMEAPIRQVSGETSRSRDSLPPPPPPPPSRKRGSSKGSVDGPLRMTSTESVPRTPPRQQQQPPSAAPGTGQGNALLADLDALQREVDALRGKMG